MPPLDLAAQVRAARTTGDLARIVLTTEGKSYHALQEIARHAQVLDDALIATLLVAGVGPCLLLDNPARPANTETLVATYYVNRLKSEAIVEVLHAAHHVLRRLIGDGYLPADGPLVQELLAIADARRKKSLAKRQITAIHVLVEHPGLGPDELTWLAEQAAGGRASLEDVRPLLADPRVALEARRALLPARLNPHDLHRLYDLPAVREDPVLRARILENAERAGVWYVLAHYAAEGGEDAAPLVRRLVAAGQTDRARDALQRGGRAVAARLTPADLLPFQGPA